MKIETRNLSPLLLIILLFAVAAAPPLSAFELLSVRAGSAANPNPTLVAIDPITGGLTEVADLPALPDVELANLGQRLFLAASEFDVSTELLEIDPASGAVLSTVPIQLNGTDITLAEGLASSAGVLQVGFNAAFANPASNRLGTLDTDGSIPENVFFCNPCDFDGLGRDAAGVLYSIDITSSETVFSLVDPLGVLTPVATFPTETLSANDLLVRGSLLYAIGDDQLHRINLTTGLVEESLTLDGTFRGLAVQPLLFSDGFDSGDLLQWSEVSP